MRRAFWYAQATTGWLLLFVALSGAIGLVIQFRALEIGFGCIKSPEAFGILSWDCQNRLMKNSLDIVLGWPRVAITCVSLFVALAQHGIIVHEIRPILNGLTFLFVSIPFMLVIWFGMAYWRQKQQAIGVSALLLLLAEIIFLAEKALF
jgi:hypothetical protein